MKNSKSEKLTEEELKGKVLKELETSTDFLLGKPFLRSEKDWAKEYEKHLAGPDADIPFGPTSGIDKCLCSMCFYRDGENNPDKDCQMVKNEAKLFFGFAKDKFLPPQIEGKEVGHYCPYWLTFLAE